MFTLTAILFTLIVLLDALLLYTYFAMKQVNFFLSLKKMFIDQNGFLFIVFNLIHATLFAYTLLNVSAITIVLSLLSVTIYLFPNVISKLLNFKFIKKEEASSKYNLSSKEVKNLLSKLERDGAKKDFIQSIRQELKEK